MSKLRRASDEIKRLDLGEGDFLDVRADISKRTFNQLVLAMPNRAISEDDGLTPAEGMEFARALFNAFVVSWSLDEEPSLEVYDNLASDAATEVDAALVDHFASLTPDNDTSSKVSTSQSGNSKAKAPKR